MRRKKINIAVHAATTDAELATRASANIGLPKFHTLASHTCQRRHPYWSQAQRPEASKARRHLTRLISGAGGR